MGEPNPNVNPRTLRPTRRVLSLATVAAAAAVSACVPFRSSQVTEAYDEEAWPPATWSAAVRFNFDETLRLRADPEAAWSPLVRVADSIRTWTISERDLTTEHYLQPHTPWYRTRDEGSLSIEVLLLPRGEHADSLAAKVVLPLSTKQAWDVLFFIRERDPRATCTDCDAAPFPLPVKGGPDSVDRFWIVWIPNSIPRGRYVP